MAVKSKWFRAGTEGKTADGRVIEKQWLIDIAETYNRNEREASIFLDHIRFFGNYGTVSDVELRDDEKGRKTIWLRIEPTPNLLQLNSEQQYKYPSLGIIPEYSDTGKAYLGHLGAVQDPASVAIEPINYSNDDGSKENMIYFASTDAIDFELTPETDKDSIIPKWFKNFISSNNENQDNDDMSKKDLENLTQQVANFNNELSTIKSALGIDSAAPKTDEAPTDFSAAINNLQAQINTLKKPDDETQKDFKTQIAKIEENLTDFGNKLSAALNEQNGTETPEHTGDAGNFSVV